MYYVKNHQFLAKNTNALNADICELAYVKLGKTWNRLNVCSHFTRIYMMTAGSAVIKNDFEEITMLPGSIYIVPAGTTFSYRCDDYFEKLYFHISVLKPDGFDIFDNLNRFITLSGCESIIKETVNATKEKSFKSFIFIKSKIYEIIDMCLAKTDSINPKFTEYSPFVKNAVSYINENLSATLKIEQIASALHVSPSKLQKQFKSEIGTPIMTYIQGRLMLAAETKLRSTSLSIKEISEALGYCDQFYFSRFFSQWHGISPLKFRNQYII